MKRSNYYKICYDDGDDEIEVGEAYIRSCSGESCNEQAGDASSCSGPQRCLKHITQTACKGETGCTWTPWKERYKFSKKGVKSILPHCEK